MKYYILLSLCLSIGTTAFSQSSEFEQKIESLGFQTIAKDWSHESKVKIPQPNCAYINITEIDQMPPAKEVDYHAKMEFYDGIGNYFKKNVILNAQGNSSLGFVKKNFAADFCEDDWIGDVTTDFSIGDWVKQDAFHFKAYYTDYFRGIATIGYKLYDQIALDRGRLWTRAPEGSISKPDENARCYPDGFPCIVYLNGNFYGVFSWQLKKHRKNMNQTKDLAEHIHIDGTLSNATLWNGTIDWTQFEVRNPKTLFTMGGAKYDGENPEELIDETSEYYDLGADDEKTKANKQLTAQVKRYIVSLSKIFSELKDLEDGGATNEQIRTAIESYFDVDGLIDYICFYYVTSNFDGFNKNWQWFTYDGNKWFVAPYDLDGTFGMVWTGDLIIPAAWSGEWWSYNSLPASEPTTWILRYYMNDIRARYNDLRTKGILTADNVKSIVRNWYYRIGEDNYTSEWAKWSDSKCISETVCNANWTTTDDRTGYSSYPVYNNGTTYNEGDRCRLDLKIWIATGTTTGIKPYSKMGYTGSLTQTEEWIDERMALEDNYLGYDATAEPSSYTLIVSNAEWTTMCVPFSFIIPDGLTVYAVNGIDSETKQLVLEQISTPEANKPYLINGSAGIYHLTGVEEDADETSEDYLANRLLHGTYETMKAPMDSYVLQNHNGKVCFYKVASDDITISPNRAYLVVPVAGNARWFDFLESLPTGITPLRTTSSCKMFLLDGRQIQAARTGINILKNENGEVKKVVVKNR